MIEPRAEFRCPACNCSCEFIANQGTYVRQGEELAKLIFVGLPCELLYRATGQLFWYETDETEEADP